MGEKPAPLKLSSPQILPHGPPGSNQAVWPTYDTTYENSWPYKLSPYVELNNPMKGWRLWLFVTFMELASNII